jgi:hypothetical protein
LHAGSVPLILAAGIVLISLAPAGRPKVGAIAYTATALLLFGVSAVYHRGHWGPRAHAFLKRWDHSNIFLLIAGSYTPFSLGQRGIVLGKAFEARGPVRKTAAPSTDGTIIATTGPSWAGSSQLPAKGRFLFKNKRSTGVPHFVVLQQVAEGTTTDQVLEFLQSGEQGQPPWGLPGGMETGSLSAGHSMTVDYDLPAGQYVVMCFFPDPKMGGMPHALMGMLEMIHLT